MPSWGFYVFVCHVLCHKQTSANIWNFASQKDQKGSFLLVASQFKMDDRIRMLMGYSGFFVQCKKGFMKIPL